VKSLGFDLFALELCACIIEIEQDAALVELLDEELWTFAGRGFWKEGCEDL